jgi:glycosyltransferase involved in cell wall biosynthesis
MPKLIRITTVPLSLKLLLVGQMRYMKEHGFDVLMISADGPEIEEVKKNENCRHVIVPMTRKITPAQDFNCMLQLVKIFKSEKPDIVHTHTPKAGLLGMMAARLANVPIRIHTVAGLRFTTTRGSKKKLLIAMEKLTYAAAQHIWPNSKSIFDFLKKNNFVKGNKLKVIGSGSSNGIDLTRFNVDEMNTEQINKIYEEIKISESDFLFLFIGRIVRDKGIEELIAAFTKISNEIPKVKLIILGPFENELDAVNKSTEEIIRSDDSVVHINWTDKVENYLTVAHVLVHPSYREGFPNVLLQAGATKTPIICSYIEGNKDIVTDNKTGYMVPAGDADALYKKMKFVYENYKDAENLAGNLYHEISAMYSRPVVHKAVLDEYNNLLQQKAAS